MGVDELAARLRHAYNARAAINTWSHFGTPAAERDRWRAVVHAIAYDASADDRERLAADLHAAYVAAIPGQREHGWPPLADTERDRWLAVADAVLDEATR